jgi:hypothetical protein
VHPVPESNSHKEKTTMKKLTGALCLFLAATFTASASNDKTAEDWKQLRAEKRRIADIAGELGALARNNHLTSWETHSLRLSELKTLINSSGERVARLAVNNGSSPQLNEIRQQLAEAANRVIGLKAAIADSRLATRTPTYYSDVMKFVSVAERNEAAAGKLIASALASQSSQSAD